MIRAWWYSTGHPATWLGLAWVVAIVAVMCMAPDAHAWMAYPPSIGHAAGIPFSMLVFNVDQP